MRRETHVKGIDSFNSIAVVLYVSDLPPSLCTSTTQTSGVYFCNPSCNRPFFILLRIVCSLRLTLTCRETSKQSWHPYTSSQPAMADDIQHLKLVNKLFRVMVTAGEMARDRGYVVHPEAIPSTQEAFRLRFEIDMGGKKALNREAMTFLCEHRESRNELMIVFNGEDSFTFDHYKRYEDQANQAHVARLIVVIAGKVVATSKRRIEECNRAEFALKTQLFPEDDLVVNITRHELVPEHTPLSEVEVTELLKAHSLEKHMLPRMLTTDPVAIYFGLEKGCVVKISRKSESAGKYVTYRQVV
jgi:DNA-directed RNA polymerases I, II, and III subunit RPABC1